LYHENPFCFVLFNLRLLHYEKPTFCTTSTVPTFFFFLHDVIIRLLHNETVNVFNFLYHGHDENLLYIK